MIAIISLALVLASVTGMFPTPSCWIRGDPADLELRISRLDSVTTALGQDPWRSSGYASSPPGGTRSTW
jgi:hypothetical protein